MTAANRDAHVLLVTAMRSVGDVVECAREDGTTIAIDHRTLTAAGIRHLAPGQRLIVESIDGATEVRLP
jgi:hypothetical protein